MTHDERNTVEAMIQAGGSFVQQLGKAYLYADPTNFERLKAAFPEYWESYTKAALQMAELRRSL